MIRLTSKFDREGSVKHTINRVFDINVATKAIENVQRIKGYLWFDADYPFAHFIKNIQRLKLSLISIFNIFQIKK